MSARRPRAPVTIMAVLVGAAVLGLGWRLNVLDVRASSPLASVATAFDPAPAYPGYGWTRSGRPVGPEELVTAAGPDHCGWQSATFLTIGWPLGTSATTFAQARLYIRDPLGVVRTAYRESLVLQATLPSDARPTGYRHGALEIFVSPSDEDGAIYLVGPSGAERWPRSDPPSLCS
ncbi:MAG TPA: hypothetical protein VIN69_08505 [Candidatus Limnocylindria bacterium]